MFKSKKVRPAAMKSTVRKGTMKRVMSYVFKYKWLFAVVLASIVLSTCVSIVSSIGIQFVIDDYITPLIGVTDPNFGPFLTMIATLGVVFLVGIIVNFVSNRLMITISERAMNDVRIDLFNHMQKLSLRFFDTNTHGDLMSRYTNDTDTLRQMIQSSLPQVISSIITVVGVFVVMMIYSWMLTLVVILLLVVMMLIAGKLGGKAGKYFSAQQSSIGKTNGYIEEMIEGQKVVKVFNHEQKAQDNFDKLNEDLRNNSAKANIFANIMMPIMMNFSNLIYVVVAIIGASVAIALANTAVYIPGVTDISLGKLIAFLMLTRAISQPIGMMAQQVNSIIMALAGADRIFRTMDEEPEVDDGKVTLVKSGDETEAAGVTGASWYWKRAEQDGKGYEYIPVRGDVRFENVTFGYVPEKTILKDISLYAKPGQKIAFVGSTGAGKTTITNLINRFYDINSGEITYDGINVKEIGKESLRRSLAMVLQDTHLFTGTVMDNIRYGRLNATDEECLAAAKLANADHFIRHLPHGYQTVLTGDGENLSQGQRQLLSIARAAVADAPVLILDEATSSIDTRTEALIEKGMDSLMNGRTVFVIAHRLSTVRNSNAIMVLEKGEIIERGDHTDLIDQRGKYYQLYTGAFELS